MADLPVNVEVTQYLVSCLPEHYGVRRHFMLTVEYRGPDSWAVCSFGGVYSVDGQWTSEPSSSERSDNWKVRYRMPLAQALALAQRLAPALTCNGVTVAAALERGPEWR
jgi:hypothetical protein